MIPCPEKEKIHYAIESIGKTATQEFGVIYAYETDGYGMYNLMDDANVPSLLAMDYLGYPSDPDVGENTRRFLLSNANPYYYEGKKAAGIGSPHTPSSYIWHISMAIRGLTSKEKEEKKRLPAQERLRGPDPGSLETNIRDNIKGADQAV